MPEDITIEKIAEKRFRITWDPSCVESIRLDDQLHIAVYVPKNIERPRIKILERAPATRRSGGYEFQIPDSPEQPVHFYLFFKGGYTNEVTPSCYIGTLE